MWMVSNNILSKSSGFKMARKYHEHLYTERQLPEAVYRALDVIKEHMCIYADYINSGDYNEIRPYMSIFNEMMDLEPWTTRILLEIITDKSSESESSVLPLLTHTWLENKMIKYVVPI